MPKIKDGNSICQTTGDALPDKDEKTPDEQEDQVHLLQEDEIQAGLQEAQPHHL